MEQKPPERRPGERLEAFMHRLSNWKIEQAFTNKASHMRGKGHGRNAAWRVAELERRLTLDPDEQW